jgi:choline dehydrogenase-like flavoprotein
MAKTFDLNDDSVVVVVGSGAGGGTLSHELAQKGVDVVCLEAGPRLKMDDIVNDGDVMFGRLSWLDKRIGTGDLNPNLPLGSARPSAAPPCIGRAPRCASRSTSSKRVQRTANLPAPICWIGR